jgi:CrcB protein
MRDVDEIFRLRRLSGARVGGHAPILLQWARYEAAAYVAIPTSEMNSRLRAGTGILSAMTTDRRELAAVFAGGAMGTVGRAGLTTLAAPDPAQWPWATFVVNIVGAFLLGYFTTRLLERLPLSSYRRPLLGTGLCGGLTTFSTMQVETLRMLEHHHYGLAACHTTASIVAGLVAVYVATALVRRVRIR